MNHQCCPRAGLAVEEAFRCLARLVLIGSSSEVALSKRQEGWEKNTRTACWSSLRQIKCIKWSMFFTVSVPEKMVMLFVFIIIFLKNLVLQPRAIVSIPFGGLRMECNVVWRLTNNICSSSNQALPLCLVLLPSPPTFPLICSGHHPFLPLPRCFDRGCLPEDQSFIWTCWLSTGRAGSELCIHLNGTELG